MGNGAGPDWDDDLIGINVNDADPRRRAPKAKAKSRKRASGGGRGGTGDRRERILRVAKLVLGGMLAAGALGLFVLSGLFLYFGSDPKLPNLKRISDYKPRQQTRVLDRNGKPIGILGGGERRTLVPFAIIPKHLINAVVAAEDPKFWEHEGIDYVAFARAAAVNLFSGRAMTGNWGQGGSTITQQVVKSLLLSREKSLRRKFQEMILARRLSQQLSKEEILTIYLNDINYGEGNYGCEAAAQYYFGKSIKDVDLGEAAFLAGVPQRPERHSPHKNPEAAKNRQMYVLRQMVEHRYIEKSVADKLAKQPIEVQPPSRADIGFAPEAVGSDLPAAGGEIRRRGGALAGRAGEDQHRPEPAEAGARGAGARAGEPGPAPGLPGALGPPRRAQAGPVPLRAEAGPGHRQGRGRGQGRRRPPRPRASDRCATTCAPSATPTSSRASSTGCRRGPTPSRASWWWTSAGVRGRSTSRWRAATPATPSRCSTASAPGDLVRVRLAPERRKGNDPSKETPLALELGPQAAMVVMEPRSREVLALVGGYDYRPGGWDRSQRASRQPGSAFKPFVYAAAIESGKYTAASIVNDAPEVYDLWKPQNYEKETFRGPDPAAHGVRRLGEHRGHPRGWPTSACRRSSIWPHERASPRRCPRTSGCRWRSGSNSVTPLELANAFATFPAGGERAPSRLMTGGERRGHHADRSAGGGVQARDRLRDGVAHAQRGRGGDGAAAGGPHPPADRRQDRHLERLSKDAWFVGLLARSAGGGLGRLRRRQVAGRGRGRRPHRRAHLDRLHGQGAGRSPHPRLHRAARPSPPCASTPRPACCPRPAATASTRCSSRAPRPAETAVDPRRVGNGRQAAVRGARTPPASA